MTIKIYKGVAIIVDQIYSDFFVVTFSDSHDMFSAKSVDSGISRGMQAIDKRLGL